MPCPSVLLLASIISTTLFVCPAFAAPGDVSLATPNVACPQAQVGDAQLQSKYDEMWNLYTTTITREAQAVETAIARLYDEAKASGNLDLVLFWESLKKSFADSGTVVWQPTTQKKDWGKRFQGAEFPSDFTAVLRKCEEGYGDAKNELESGYRLLIAELTKQGKVAEAQAVKSELASLWTREAAGVNITNAPRPVPSAPHVVPRKLMPTGTWRWPDDTQHTTITLNPDGTATASWHKEPGVWTLGHDNKLRMIVTSKRAIRVGVMSPDGTTMMIEGIGIARRLE